MWKRDESVRPVSARASGGKYSAGQASGLEGKSIGDARRSGADVVNIGQSVVIKGEVHGSEDLFIEGRVEGKIEMSENVLTIGPNGIIKGGLFAKSVIVLGKVTGNITATEKSTFATKGLLTVTLPRREWLLPKVLFSEGALTCRVAWRRRCRARRSQLMKRSKPNPLRSRRTRSASRDGCGPACVNQASLGKS